MPVVNVVAGWLAMLAGVLSGAVAGLFFHREDWLGGYNSYRRRLIRLGHISFFGLGFVNLMFATTAQILDVRGSTLKIASIAFLIGMVTMPACCFLSAWRKPLRHLFPIPVAAVFVGIVAILSSWWLR